jgi:hypothetical protein
VEPDVTYACIPDNALPGPFETAGIHRPADKVREDCGVVTAGIAARPESETLLPLESTVLLK